MLGICASSSICVMYIHLCHASNTPSMHHCHCCTSNDSFQAYRHGCCRFPGNGSGAQSCPALCAQQGFLFIHRSNIAIALCHSKSLHLQALLTTTCTWSHTDVVHPSAMSMRLYAAVCPSIVLQQLIACHQPTHMQRCSKQGQKVSLGKKGKMNKCTCCSRTPTGRQLCQTAFRGF